MSNIALLFDREALAEATNGDTIEGIVYIPGQPYPGPPPPDTPDSPDPAPPEEGDDYNHFGDWIDNQWGMSFTEGQDFYSNKNVSSAEGQEYSVVIPDYLAGREVRLACGGPNAVGNVRVKNADGSTIIKEYLTDGGSIMFVSAIAQTVKVKMIDGHDQAQLQWDLYVR